MSALSRFLDRWLPLKVIMNCDGDPYLYRWYLISKPWLGVYLHKFVRSDEDRAPHDHPWSFIVIPIWRGYVEHSERKCKCLTCVGHPTQGARMVPRRTRVRPIIGTRWRPATYRHRVALIRDGTDKELPSWSIFIRFKKSHDWGFWPGERTFIGWREWWRDKGCD